MLLMILMVTKLLEHFIKINSKKPQKEFRIEKVNKKKRNKLYVKWKDYNNSFTSWIDKKDIVKEAYKKMSQYFPKPYKIFGGDINVKVDFSNYATKADLKNAAGVDISQLELKSNLVKLRAHIYKNGADKLKPVTADLSKSSNVVNNDVVKKTVYDKLVAKANNIGTSGFVLKTKYNADKSDLEKKYIILVNLLKKQIIMLKLLK